jgi:hypothetical protein
MTSTPGIVSLEAAGWWGVGIALLVVVVLVSWLLRRRALRRKKLRARSLSFPQATGAREEIEKLEGGLRQFAGEVGELLDRKLDRLEVLVAEADRVLDALGHHEGPGEGGGAEGPSGRTETLGAAIAAAASESAASRGTSGGLDGITPAQRERILTLGQEGHGPEAIADAVSLRRGEVDLILRLHQISERSPRSV